MHPGSNSLYFGTLINQSSSPNSLTNLKTKNGNLKLQLIIFLHCWLRTRYSVKALNPLGIGSKSNRKMFSWTISWIHPWLNSNGRQLLTSVNLTQEPLAAIQVLFFKFWHWHKIKASTLIALTRIGSSFASAGEPN